MKRLGDFARVMLPVSRAIGRKDFPAAIRLLEDCVALDPADTAALGLLAQCHRWSGWDDNAMKIAETITRVDPHDFIALRLLGEILASRGEHQRAVAYVRRGLEHYPEPMRPLPQSLAKVAKLAMRILRPRRPIAADDLPWERINAEHREWFEWAKRYLAWFDKTTGGGTLPVLH